MYLLKMTILGKLEIDWRYKNMTKLKSRAMAFIIFCVSVLMISLYTMGNNSDAHQEEGLTGLANKLFMTDGEKETVYFIELAKEPIMELKEYEKDVLSSVEGALDSESKSRLAKIKKTIDEYQKKQFNLITRIDEKAELREQFDFIVNGISIKTKYKYLEKIRQLEEVTDISAASHLMPSGKIENINFKKFNTENQGTWSGEGIVIAVIDSGIENIEGFTMEESVKVKLTKDEIHGKGKYFSSKIPYGYNYADDNTNIVCAPGDYHGQVVASIIGGRSEDDKSRTKLIKGLAPKAQLLILKVFSDNKNKGLGYSDVLVAAIEDAIEHGADIINMSVGVRNIIDGEIEGKVLNAIQKRGIIMVASVANSSFSSYPFKIPAIPDDGAIFSPGRSKDILGIGAVAKISEEPEDKIVFNYEMLKKSSWGPTYDLRIKPDVSAVGVVPLVPDQQHPEKSTQGTSFAAPVVTSTIAQLLEKFREQKVEFKNNVHKIEFIRSSIVNTAKIMVGESEVPYSIRNQGGGLLNTKSLLTNLIVAGQNNSGKVELGSFTNKKIVFAFEIKNYGNTPAYCEISHGGVYTNNTIIEKFTSFPVLTDSSITFDIEKVTIPSGESQIIMGTLKISDQIPNNHYIESYLLIDHGTGPSLSVPLLGFYGDFANLQLFDNWRWEKGSYVKRSGVYKLNKKDQLEDLTHGLIGDKVTPLYLSQNLKGVFIKVDPLRHVKDFSIHLFTDKKQWVYKIAEKEIVVKSLWLEDEDWLEDNQDPAKIKFTNFYTWMFKSVDDKGKEIDPVDGKYLIRVSGTPLISGAKAQIKEIPIVLDATPPKISEVKIEVKSDYTKVNFKAKDELSGIGRMRIVYDDDSFDELSEDAIKAAKKTFGGYSIKISKENGRVLLYVYDLAGNYSVIDI